MRIFNHAHRHLSGRLQIGLILTILAAAAVLLTNSIAANPQQGPPAPPHPSQDPIVRPNLDDDEASIYVELDFSRRTAVQATEVEIIHGRARMNITDPPLLQVDAYDEYDKLAGSYNAWHPLWQFYLDADGEEVFHIQDQGSGQMILPFQPELDKLTITDVGAGQQILQIDLDPAIIEFCTDNPAHPYCISDLTLTKTSTPESVLVGERIQYTLTVENEGTNPVRTFEVVDTLPKGVTYLGNSPYCVEAPAGTLTCTLDETLTVGETFDIEIDVLVNTDLQFGDRRPLSLANHATVAMLAGDDSDLSNNDAVAATDVHAVGDLAITSFAEAGDEAGAYRVPPRGKTLEVYTINLVSTITNYGPSTPIDAATGAAVKVLDPGVIVAVEGSNPDAALGLEVGETRTITDQLSITCEQPGLHQFVVTKQVSPLDPADIDSDLANNVEQLKLSVVCQGEGNPKK